MGLKEHTILLTLPNVSGNSRVGFSPGYNQGYGQHIWGMQFEEVKPW